MSRDAGGFTLVEVLVATAVLATGILGFLQATLVAERLRLRARASGEAAALAEEGIERLCALGWERATTGLPLERRPELTGSPDPLPAARSTGHGVEYLVLFERGADGVRPAPVAVRCFWALPGRDFERGLGVTLRTRPR